MLASGNDAIALLGNTVATGAILVVLILIFGPISGAHFNPAVTLAFTVRRMFPANETAPFILAQIIGGLLGVLVAHFMFELEPYSFSSNVRTGFSQWGAEVVATFGLVATILGCLSFSPTSPLRSWAFHHVRLLVYVINVVCKPCCDNSPEFF